MYKNNIQFVEKLYIFVLKWQKICGKTIKFLWQNFFCVHFFTKKKLLTPDLKIKNIGGKTGKICGETKKNLC